MSQILRTAAASIAAVKLSPAPALRTALTLLAAITLLAALALLGAPGKANASSAVSINASDSGMSFGFSYFEDDLEPYGEWVDYAPYGQCWVPAGTPYGWRPYYDGYWGYTDCGWNWVSNEPWGWATYHYGRWNFDPYYGWVWIPGTVWAPSWVAWHHGDGYVGWAPLPPTARWNVSVGLNFGGVDYIPARNWCFVEQQHFTHSKVKYKVVNVSRNDEIFHRTRNRTHFDTWNGHPRNVGFDVATVNSWGGQKAKQLRVVDAKSPRKGREGRGENVRGNTVEYYRPQFAKESKTTRETRVRSDERQVTREVKHAAPVKQTAPSKQKVNVASKRPTKSAPDRQFTKHSLGSADRELAMVQESRREKRAPREQASQRVNVERAPKQRAEKPRAAVRAGAVQERGMSGATKERVEARDAERKRAAVDKQSDTRRTATSKGQGKAAKMRDR